MGRKKAARRGAQGAVACARSHSISVRAPAVKQRPSRLFPGSCRTARAASLRVKRAGFMSSVTLRSPLSRNKIIGRAGGNETMEKEKAPDGRRTMLFIMNGCTHLGEGGISLHLQESFLAMKLPIQPIPIYGPHSLRGHIRVS